MTEYNKNTDQYSQGFRFVLVEQYAKSIVLIENTGAPWGHGVYILHPDNTLGDCVDWNFDSSG